LQSGLLPATIMSTSAPPTAVPSTRSTLESRVTAALFSGTTVLSYCILLFLAALFGYSLTLLALPRCRHLPWARPCISGATLAITLACGAISFNLVPMAPRQSAPRSTAVCAPL
ncbi:hypothetical protein FA95DRAFT_1568017, partial [Auriscalpium vulgare]